MVFMAELSSLHSRDSHRIGPTLTMTQSQQAAIPTAAIPTKLESTAGRVGSVSDFKAWQGKSERLRCVIGITLAEIYEKYNDPTQ